MVDQSNPGENAAPANLNGLEEQFGAETAKDLVKAYLEDTDEVIEKMQEAILSRDVKALKPLAHMLKSASRIVGATELSQYSVQMEGFCVEGQSQWLQVESFFETFTASFQATNSYLRQYLQ